MSALPWSILPHPLAFVQLCADGLLPRTGRVTELAVLRMEPGQPTRWLDSRVDPGGTQPGLPAFANLVPDLRAMLDGAILVSHNAPLVALFLDAELARLGGAWGNPSLCTLSLSRALEPGATAHNQDAMARHLGLPRPDGRAFTQARTTTALLAELLARQPEDDAAAIARGAVEIPTRPTRWPNIVGSLVPVTRGRGEARASGS